MISYLKDILFFQPNQPLIFTGLFFWGFFAFVLSIYTVIYKQKPLRNAFLFFVSVFFYYKTSGIFFILLLFTIFSDFNIAKLIYKTPSPTRKKWLLALTITLNLLLLSYFKYAYFYIDNINHLFGTHFTPVNYFAQIINIFSGSHFDIDKIILPVGISFYTFQTLSYSIDVYRGELKPVDRFLDFGFYVSFFPQLVAGPIVRASEFIPQIYQEYKLSKAEFGHALFLILNGLIKKMLIGDYIAVNFIDRVFDNPLSYSGFENVMALYAYSLQVYADFSGYTDIAIGIALLMGFRLSLNFNSPYKAANVADFWKRWHISLSTWLKDYLYIPMGGNRSGTWFTYIAVSIILSFVVLLSGKFWLIYIFAGLAGILFWLTRLQPQFLHQINTNINLLVTMLIGGLWHGASWQFVIWGGLNGIGLVVYKSWRKISPFGKQSSFWGHFWGVLITFNFISFTRIWFRSDTMEGSYNILNQIANQFSFLIIPDVVWAFKTVFAMVLVGLIIHWLPTPIKEKYRGWFIQSSLLVQGIITFLVVILLYQTRTAELQPFIYFQF